MTKLKFNTQRYRTALVLALLLSACTALEAQGIAVTNDTQSIQVVNLTVRVNGDSKKVELELKNAGNSPLLGVTYLTNKDLFIATFGYGEEQSMTEYYLPKDRIAAGKVFKTTITGDLTMVQVTVGGAVFKDHDEGDPLLCERIKADQAGMEARAKQLLAVLKDPSPGTLTADEIAKLEATIKALPDAAPSKKMSARGRRAFLYGQQTERETVLQSIAELKKRMKVTELDREDEYKYLRKHSAEVAEVLQ
jgi:hypothetical protein